MGGLRYESGRQMPPGMQELAAVKLAAQLQEAAALVRQMFPSSVTAEAATPSPQGEGIRRMEVGDRIRSMTNEELVEKLYWLYSLSWGYDREDVSKNWCDLKGGCCGAGDEEIQCSEEKHKACILRWLESEVAV